MRIERSLRARAFFRIFLLLTLVFSASCSQRQEQNLVKIGSRIWSGRNLDVDRYRNGDPVRHAQTEAEWHDAASKQEGAWCWYDGDAMNGSKYGKLYNWHAVNDRRGLAPAGWHIPSDDEWQQLVESLGGNAVAGAPMKKTSSWNASGASASQSSGFDALPSGSRNCLGGFFALGRDAYFWSSTPSGGYEAWNREIGSRNDGVRRVSVGRSLGFSVRCVRD
ncbi:MAG: fibrobacter succinogenes major paralogous domain-containing protein [Chlorobi bacterium]|nr:fibrobacter succinogenes major paralogous domain-containing protein [Chlorobiota bacterium]